MVARRNVEMPADILVFELHIHAPGLKVSLAGDLMRDDIGTEGARGGLVAQDRFLVVGLLRKRRTLAADFNRARA